MRGVVNPQLAPPRFRRKRVGGQPKALTMFPKFAPISKSPKAYSHVTLARRAVSAPGHDMGFDLSRNRASAFLCLAAGSSDPAAIVIVRQTRRPRGPGPATQGTRGSSNPTTRRSNGPNPRKQKTPPRPDDPATRPGLQTRACQPPSGSPVGVPPLDSLLA